MYDNNIYKVGETYDTLKTMENCAIMLWNNYLGFKIVLRTPNPTAEDKLFFDTGRPFELRWWEHHEGVVFFAFRFGGIKMWCDSVFSASENLYEKNVPNFPRNIKVDEGYKVTVIGINSSTGEVFGIREIALPFVFSQRLNAACIRTATANLTAEEFNRVADSVYEPQDGTVHDGSYIANIAWESDAEDYAGHERIIKKYKDYIIRHPKTRRFPRKKGNYYVFSTESSELIHFPSEPESVVGENGKEED